MVMIFKDYLSGWKHWDLQRVFPNGSQLFTRTINDMIPLKAFRAQTSIAASPNLILAAILHNRWSYGLLSIFTNYKIKLKNAFSHLFYEANYSL